MSVCEQSCDLRNFHLTSYGIRRGSLTGMILVAALLDGSPKGNHGSRYLSYNVMSPPCVAFLCVFPSWILTAIDGGGRRNRLMLNG